MKRFFFLLAGFSLLLGACSKDDPAPEIPEDADDNFITSVVMTVSDQSYTAEIADNVITVTVPYTVSLDNAQVEFVYTPSAKILPDPATITDWDTERMFRVTSYNGAANEYTYKVVKDEIRHEGDVELKTAAQVAAFAATDATVIKGNLIIGSNEENAGQITDISALSLLKEVEGNIIIRNSFNGADLTGLENITSIGGLQIGSADAFAANAELHMVSMKSLADVGGDILVRNNQVAFVQFDKLAAVGGDIIVGSTSLQSFDFPVLATVGGDLDVQAATDDEKPSGEITALELPELTAVGGVLGINNLEKLISISLPKLTEAGSIYLASIPIAFETLTLTELSVVNGDLTLIANYFAKDAFSSTGNNKMLAIDGLANLTVVKGTLTISKFEALEELPEWSKLTKLGGIKLFRLLNYYGKELDLSKVEFEPFGDAEPTISITDQTLLAKLITKDDMSKVNIILSCAANTGNPGKAMNTVLNFRSVKDFTDDNRVDEDPVYSFERVYGNLSLTRSGQTESGISAPNLTGVDGYMHINISNGSDLNFPNLENVGGQMYLEGSTAYQVKYDFSKLKTVCCADNPQYAIEGADNRDIFYGGLDVTISNAESYDFPLLERVGGSGLTVRGVGAFSCPELHTIDGFLCASNARAITSSDLKLPRLAKLSGVRFYRLTKFVDFTMFGPFIRDGQIKAENWSIASGGYNPTYAQMVAGAYTKQ